jgi:hypothetical protein
MVDVVEQTFDVKFDNPIMIPTPSSGDRNRVVR